MGAFALHELFSPLLDTDKGNNNTNVTSILGNCVLLGTWAHCNFSIVTLMGINLYKHQKSQHDLVEADWKLTPLTEMSFCLVSVNSSFEQKGKELKKILNTIQLIWLNKCVCVEFWPALLPEQGKGRWWWPGRRSVSGVDWVDTCPLDCRWTLPAPIEQQTKIFNHTGQIMCGTVNYTFKLLPRRFC